jgi:hypothetical protein
VGPVPDRPTPGVKRGFGARVTGSAEGTGGDWKLGGKELRTCARLRRLTEAHRLSIRPTASGVPGPYFAMPSCVNSHAYSNDWSFKRS